MCRVHASECARKAVAYGAFANVPAGNTGDERLSVAESRGRSLGPRWRRIGGTALAGAAGQGGLVVSGILAARMLGPVDRGHLALLILVPLVIALVGSCGLPVALTRAIAQQRDRAGTIVRAARRLILVQVVVLTAVADLIAWRLSGGDSETVRAAALATLPLELGLLGQIYGLAILQGQHRFRAFNVMRTAPS